MWAGALLGLRSLEKALSSGAGASPSKKEAAEPAKEAAAQ